MSMGAIRVEVVIFPVLFVVLIVTGIFVPSIYSTLYTFLSILNTSFDSRELIVTSMFWLVFMDIWSLSKVDDPLDSVLS